MEPMHPARLYAPGPHVGLCVTDLDRARDFYVNLLGFLWDSAIELPGHTSEKLLRLPGLSTLKAEYLWREGFCLEFLWYEGVGREPNPRAPSNALGINYLALEASNLPEVLKRLRASGAEIVEERSFSQGDQPVVVFVRDPDGELVELTAQGAIARGVAGGKWLPVKPHLKLVVSDLDRSVQFYRDVLGLQYENEYTLEGEGISKIVGLPDVKMRQAALWRQGFCLLLRQFENPKPLPRRGGAMNQLGYTHLSFQVYDLARTIARAREFGVDLMEDTLLVIPPDERPRVSFLRDPDGQLIEAIQL